MLLSVCALIAPYYMGGLGTMPLLTADKKQPIQGSRWVLADVWPFKSISTKRICLQTEKRRSLTRWQWPPERHQHDGYTTASWMNVVAGACRAFAAAAALGVRSVTDLPQHHSQLSCQPSCGLIKKFGQLHLVIHPRVHRVGVWVWWPRLEPARR